MRGGERMLWKTTTDQGSHESTNQQPLERAASVLRFKHHHIFCCVEAEWHFCYLRDSSLYVHESYPLGYQRHPLTYVGHRRFWYGPLTKYGS
jgi:hypothetical protein